MFRSSFSRHPTSVRSLTSNAFATRRPPVSFMSSLPPSTHKLDPSKQLDTPPPNLPPNRKPKLDLRPGPLKSTDANRPASKTPRLSPNGTPTSSSTTTTTTPPQAHSVTETSRRDFEDAAKHGILARPPPDATHLRRILHQAKELIKFYWRGLKMINANRKRVTEIRKRIREGGPPISRWESRLIQTHKEDTLKLVPFIILVILLEEVIPLIAIYAPFMLPSTCVLPSQRARIQDTKRTRQISYAKNNRLLFRKLSKELPAIFPNPTLSQAICGLLGLSTFGFNVIRTRRIRRHLNFLVRDDELLARENMGTMLSHSELSEALQERGIVTAGLSEKDQAARLKWWLTSVNDVDHTSPITRRLFLVAKNAAGG